MNYNESDFKKLGFRNKKGNKNVLEASAEVSREEYITIQLEVINHNVTFLGIEVLGSRADQKRKEYLKEYSIKEIYKLFSDY